MRGPHRSRSTRTPALRLRSCASPARDRKMHMESPMIRRSSRRSWVALGLFLLPSTLAAQELQWAKNPANNHWYGIPFSPTTWTAGEALGVQLGGHLATVRSASENTWISQNFAGFSPNGYWI